MDLDVVLSKSNTPISVELFEKLAQKKETLSPRRKNPTRICKKSHSWGAFYWS